MLRRWNKPGLQLRIMTYVVIGLALIFAAFAFIGLRSVQQATELVYGERLNTAYTTAGIINRDFLHAAQDANEIVDELPTGGGPNPQISAQDLEKFFSRTDLLSDSFPFFRITGIWVIGSDGKLLAETGLPKASPGGNFASFTAIPDGGADQLMILPAPGTVAGSTPFVTIVTRVPVQAGQTSLFVAIHTVSLNSRQPYTPAYYWGNKAEVPVPAAQVGTSQDMYHLEVMGPDGTTLLGIGPDEHPGQESIHFPALRALGTRPKATIFLHKPGPGDAFEAHIMALVPLTDSGFYLTLEQPADLALAAPRKLQDEILIIGSISLVFSLLSTWFVARAVARPLRQLQSATRVIANGDLANPVRITARDEVGELAEEVEAMRQQLKSSHDGLEQANAHLERQVAERTQKLQETLGKVFTAQEEERQRLARDLHDQQGQALGALAVSFDRVSRLLGAASSQVQEELEQARAMVHSLLQDTRRMIYDLRPSVLDDMGLEAALRWSAKVHLESNGVAVSIQSSLSPSRLPGQVEVVLFRVAQEAIVNIRRHAQARHAGVVLEHQGSSLKMRIWDDGRGIDDKRRDDVSEGSGLGLESMRERVRLIGGRIEIVTAPGAGTSVNVEITLG